MESLRKKEKKNKENKNKKEKKKKYPEAQNIKSEYKINKDISGEFNVLLSQIFKKKYLIK